MEFKLLVALYGCPVCMALAISLLTTSLATNHWLHSSDKTSRRFGLFMACTDNYCISNDQLPDGLVPVRGLCLTGLVLTFCAFFAMIHFVLNLKGKIQRAVSMFFCASAALLTLSGVWHYKRLSNDSDYDDLDNGYSYHLAWLAAVIVFVTGCVFYPAVKYVRNNRSLWFADDSPPSSNGHVFNTSQNMTYPNAPNPFRDTMSDADWRRLLAAMNNRR